MRSDITMLLTRIVSRLAQTTQTVRMSLFAIRSPKVYNLARKGWGIPNQLLETTKNQMIMYRPRHNEKIARLPPKRSLHEAIRQGGL